jgi:ubiquinone/menaquinone biosynthesis C-methylase UbiE
LLKTVDYNDHQHVGYAAGRDHGLAHARGWAEVFAAPAPTARPLAVLDLGCGTGRFLEALAETFGGPIYGVEPSERMRVQAAARGIGGVEVLAGRAEAIPLPDASCDLVLMFLSFHHVRDKPTAAAEIARVLRPGGRVLIRSQFPERFPDIAWHAYFPSARQIELEMFPALAEVEAVFAGVGLERRDLVTINELFADSVAEHAARLKYRAISTFEHLRESEIVDGFARLDVAVAQETTPRPVFALSDVLVLGTD